MAVDQSPHLLTQSANFQLVLRPDFNRWLISMSLLEEQPHRPEETPGLYLGTRPNPDQVE
jgi:hypothetical protein